MRKRKKKKIQNKGQVVGKELLIREAESRERRGEEGSVDQRKAFCTVVALVAFGVLRWNDN